MVPDVEGHPFQHIDTRDFADWIVTAGEQRVTGVHDAVSPVVDFAEPLARIADLVAPQGTELVPVTPEKLTEAGIGPWLGRKRLPEEFYGMVSHDATGAWEAGLRIRPFDDTVRVALREELESRAHPGGRGVRAGTSPLMWA